MVYTISIVLTRGIYIFLVPIYTRYLTPTEYGTIDYFTILASIINLTIALEITQAVARFYQDATDSHKKEYASTAFLFSLFIYSLYFIVSYIFSTEFSKLFLDDPNFSVLFIIASGAIATNGIFYFLQNQLKWQIQPKDFAIVSVVNVAILAVITTYLLVVASLKIESIFIGQIIANIVASLLSIYMAKESYGLIFHYHKFKEMISFSAPLVLSGISVFIALYIDRIAIKDLLGLEALGIYGLAFRFASVTTIVMIGFESALMPLVYKHYKEKRTSIDIANIFSIFSIFALVVVAGSIVFSKELVMFLTTKAFYSASNLIPILVLTSFFSKMYIFSPGLAIAKKTKIIAIITTTSAILNTTLNYALIPHFDLYGAAYATFITVFIVFLLYVKLSVKYYQIPYQIKKLLISLIFVLVTGYFLNYILDDITLLMIFIKLFFVITIFITLVFILVEQGKRAQMYRIIKDKYSVWNKRNNQ